MSDLKIITNNVPRDLMDAWDLTEAERAEFDYLNWPAIDRGEDSGTFFRYRGDLYDLGEFMRTGGSAGDPLADWDGYAGDSFFSGVLVRFVEDCERVVVGLYLS